MTKLIDCGEGPFPTEEAAGQFADTEVGAPCWLYQGADGQWHVLVEKELPTEDSKKEEPTVLEHLRQHGVVLPFLEPQAMEWAIIEHNSPVGEQICQLWLDAHKLCRRMYDHGWSVWAALTPWLIAQCNTWYYG
ncbi:MAG: hypothetical protein ACOY3P_20270 [Planctomycetota bacterium]